MSENASRDQNSVPTLLAVLETDGSTIVRIRSSVNHQLSSANGTGGIDYGPSIAPRDENSVPTLMGVSSVDGVTPVVIYADIEGKLLINNQ